MAKKKSLKRTTEGLIMAAQEQAIRTNHTKAKIDKTQENSKCRMCGKAEERVNHVLSECSKLAQRSIKDDMIGLVRRSNGKYVENKGQK